MQSTITDETSAVNEAIAEKIGAQKFRIWFKDSTRLSLSDGYVKVAVPNLFMAGWIENHFAKEISEAARTATGTTRKVIFTVDPELAGHQRQSRLDSQEPQQNAPQQSGSRQHNVSRTLPGKNQKLTLESFVVGQSNELAYNAVRAVVSEKQSPFNPLFIHGGYGVGKTHLLQGICNQVRKNRPETNWLYLSAEDFANQFVLALKTKKLEAFRCRMRRTDLLAIDDIHFLASKPSTQEEFLYTFNTIDLAGKQVVLASDAHPKMIGQLSEKLVNRFISGMVVKIESPDFKTRCQICRRYAVTIGGQIPENVITYIAENLRSNVRELEGAMIRLVAFSSLQNEKISLALAQGVLAEHIERCDPIMHISDIESAAASYFGITTAELHSSKKDNTVAMARHFSMYLARKHTKMSSTEVGRFMGNKNHATVLLACKKIEEQISRNAELHWHGPTGSRISKARDVLACLEDDIAG